MATFAEKPFQAPKIILNFTKLIGQQLLSYIFGRVNLSGLATWKFTTKEDLNS